MRKKREQIFFVIIIRRWFEKHLLENLLIVLRLGVQDGELGSTEFGEALLKLFAR